MRHRANPKFWATFRGIPPETQRLARRHFQLLQDNPRHPSLHLKQVGRYWSARVGGYRAVAIQRDDDLVWFWIGPHDEYIRLIRS